MMKRQRVFQHATRLAAALAALLTAPGAAHHSAGVSYDVDTVNEFAGVVTEVTWRNPHVYFTVSADDGSVWSVESNSVSILQRMGVTAGMVDPGDRVRVAGWARDVGGGTGCSL